MTNTARSETHGSLLIGGLLAIIGLMSIATMALLVRELTVVTGLVLVGLAVAGRRRHVPTILVAVTAGFGVVLLCLGALHLLA